jgi:chemotaxis-related protein WspB
VFLIFLLKRTMLALTFQIGEEKLALDIRRVREVVPRVRLRRVSGAPDWHAGVFVYRGEVVPVVDLHRLAGAEPCPEHLSSRIILISPSQAQRFVGLLASQVADTRELALQNCPASSMAQADKVDLGALVADGQGVIRLFDPDRFLPEAAWQQLLIAPKGAGP